MRACSTKRVPRCLAGRERVPRCLTGLAQVSGRRNLNFDERRKLDVYYVQNWSLWMDLVIIMKTIRAVFGGSGAK